MPRRRHVLAGLAGTGLAGCNLPRSGSGAATPVGTSPPTATASGPDAGPRTTHLQPSGNRVVEGRPTLPGGDPVDIETGLDGDPTWVVALPADGATDWLVADGAGDLVARRVGPGGVRRLRVSPDTLPAGRPPVLARAGGELQVPVAGVETARYAHPLVLPDGYTTVTGEGELVVATTDGPSRFPVDAPPDAHPVRAAGRVVVLSDATDRYDHGVLGDAVEADGFAVVSIAEQELIARVAVPGDAVIEGLAPILADLTGDGRPEVIVTESDGEAGARVVAYSLDGERLGSGPPIGSGLRWRHQLAVAPFGGRPELAVVRTPHIGGTAEFYRFEDDGLRIVAREGGVSSHTIGSRVLDGGVAVPGDGTRLVVPSDDRRELVGIERAGGGATTDWRAPVGGQVASNLHAVPVAERVAFGVARADGVLRVWP